VLRITAFGELIVLRGQRRVDSVLQSGRLRALLILLAAHGAAGISRGRALTLLSAGDEHSADDAAAIDQWEQDVAELQGALGAEHLARSGDAVALDPERATSDLVEFRDAIVAGELERAVRLHEARLAEGWRYRSAPAFDRWLLMQREALASDAAAALERLAERAARQGEPLAAVHWWRQLAVQYPLNNRIAASLMEALVAAGDREGAVRHAQYLEALAGEQLDLPGDAQVLQLASALRTSTPRAPVAGVAAAENGDGTANIISCLRAELGTRYGVEGEIGRGAFGVVVKAQDLRHTRPVAIKVLHPELASSLTLSRFSREIRIVASLQHPNILPLFDSGTVGDTLYYVAPYIADGSLRDRLLGNGPVPAREAIVIARQIARALTEAHRRGVIHRDIKPENILLSGGDVLLADFGIALTEDSAGTGNLTVSGHGIGTPAYMSPEQASEAGRVDGRSDVYSLACVLLEMLTGQRPDLRRWRGDLDPAPLLQGVPDVTHFLTEALRTALRHDPAQRHSTASDFHNALEAAERSIDRHSGSGLRLFWQRLALRLVVLMLLTLLGFGTQLDSFDDPRLVAVEQHADNQHAAEIHR
jgi:DNA-binding SARP family transcriptional activator/tRNA A-37 threonylcarbamoyl transferase component Bud32